MSYLEKLTNIKEENKKEEKKITNVLSGWKILPLKKNKIIEENKKEENKKEENEKEENKEEKNYISYEEEFYIKYGSELFDFFLDMKEECDNKMYNILNKNRNSNYISSDFLKLILDNTIMQEEENEEEEEENEYIEENNSM